MDEQLVALLDAHDWEEIIGKLTLAALNQLKLCGLSTDKEGKSYIPSGTHPQGYALDAMARVYEGCSTGENRWDPERGELYPFLERLVRRLVTDDKKKYSKRAPSISYDQTEVNVETEQATGELLNALYAAAGEEVQELILVLQENVEKDGAVNWTEIRRQLTNTKGERGISKHELAKRRAQLENLLLKHDLYKPLEMIT